MRLLLVRHGATAWNVEQRLQGDTDVGLSATGHAQVEALAPWVARERPTYVTCSPLTRTRQTAALLGVEVDRIDPRWREADVGEWNGRHVRDLPAQRYAAWRAGEQAPPGGEPIDRIAARVHAALADLVALPDDTVALVVTHGGPVRAVLRGLIDPPTDPAASVGPATLTVLERVVGGWALVT